MPKYGLKICIFNFSFLNVAIYKFEFGPKMTELWAKNDYMIDKHKTDNDKASGVGTFGPPTSEPPTYGPPTSGPPTSGPPVLRSI